MPFAGFRVFRYWNENSLVSHVMGAFLAAFSVSSAHSAEVELAWNASSSGNVAGYYVVWGLSSGNYSGQADVGNKTTHTVTGLVENTTYYFATKAYDSGRTTESALSGGVSTKTPYDPPTANFTATNRSGTAPLTVTFNDTSSGFVSDRSWDFGDGGMSNGTTAVYSYTKPGTYTVSLNVTGPGGEDTETKGAYVVVQAPSGDSGGDGGSTGDGSGGDPSDGGSENGLVAGFGFEEQGDAQVRDVSPNGNDGIVSGATSISDGRYGRALQFDGVNDWVTVNDYSTLDLSDGMTIEAWVYPTEIGGWGQVVMKEDSGWYSYSLVAHTSADVPFTAIGVDGRLKTGLSGPAPLPVDQWTHLAATYDASRQRLYVNGVEAAQRSQSGRIVPSDGVLRIGGDSVWGNYFKGRIDEVRIYDRALSEQEIRSDMDTPVQSSGSGGGGDTTPPEIAGVQVEADQTTATITWTTDEAATSEVGYGGTTPPYGLNESDAELVTSHSVMLTGLEPETVYHYAVTSKDGAGNASNTADATFNTTADGASDGRGGDDSGSGNAANVELRLDEGAGSIAYDSSGAGNDGTLRNGASFVADSGDGSAQSVGLDGSNDYIDLGSLDVSDSGLTLATWFKADRFPNGDPRLISKASGTAENKHVFMLSSTIVDSKNRLRARVRVGGKTKTLIASSGDLGTGVWRHGAATYDGTRLRLFLDGTEVGSTPLTGPVDIDPGMSVAIGGQPPGAGGRFFDGFLDDVRIYSRALSKAEIQALSSPSGGTSGGGS